MLSNAEDLSFTAYFIVSKEICNKMNDQTHFDELRDGGQQSSLE